MESRDQSIFSPNRWFWDKDDLLRPGLRVLLFLFLSGFVSTLVVNVMGVRPNGAVPRTDLFGVYALQVATLLLQSWFFLSVFDRRSFRSLGLWPYVRFLREFGLGAGLGAVLMVVVVLGMSVGGAVRFVGLSQQEGVGTAFLSSALFFLLVSVYEESLFRGYVFQRLSDSIGQLGAVFLLSVLFGLAHLRNPSPTPLSTTNTILAGILLATAYLKTRALWLPMGLHWTWNLFLGPVFSLPVSGLRTRGPLLLLESGGPLWLSGGNYGPEGSIVLTIVCAAAIVGLWKAPWISPSPAMQDVLK